LPPTPDYSVPLTQEKAVANIGKHGWIIGVLVIRSVIHQHEVKFIATIEHSVKDLVVAFREVNRLQNV
jgi:hypothetical protein